MRNTQTQRLRRDANTKLGEELGRPHTCCSNQMRQVQPPMLTLFTAETGARATAMLLVRRPIDQGFRQRRVQLLSCATMNHGIVCHANWGYASATAIAHVCHTLPCSQGRPRTRELRNGRLTRRTTFVVWCAKKRGALSLSAACDAGVSWAEHRHGRNSGTVDSISRDMFERQLRARVRQAVKRVRRTHKIADVESCDGAAREVRTLEKLRHPGVVCGTSAAVWPALKLCGTGVAVGRASRR